MFTIKLIQIDDVAPYSEARYTVLATPSYMVERNRAPHPTDGMSQNCGPWRAQIELEDRNGEPLSVHVGKQEMWQKAYVMNATGKTIDIIT